MFRRALPARGAAILNRSQFGTGSGGPAVSHEMVDEPSTPLQSLPWVSGGIFARSLETV
jgi:hypothetical protein